MKRKLVLSLLISLSLMSMNVSAAGVTVSGDPVTSTVPSEFTADENQVGGGASVL